MEGKKRMTRTLQEQEAVCAKAWREERAYCQKLQVKSLFLSKLYIWENEGVVEDFIRLER